MIPGLGWQPAFLAVSALLGESIEGSVASMGDAPTQPAAELIGALRSTSRDVRARALAAAITAVLVELDGARLA